MNHRIPLELAKSRLDENDLAYEVLDIGGGISVIVSQRGGRIFGPFVDGGESILWLNAAFKERGEFKEFLESGEWNLGGNRVWIAPEHRYNVKDRTDLFGTYILPEDVDPGCYEITRSGDQALLTADASIPAWNPEAAAKQLRIERAVVPAANPLREAPGYASLSDGVTYGGYLHEAHLKEATSDGLPAEFWDLAQVNVGGMAYASVFEGDTRLDFYEPSGPEHYTVFPHYARLKIDGKYMYKVGYKAPQFLGRIVFHNSLQDGTEYLYVRAFFVNPSATYTMEPAETPGDCGYPVQIFNDNGSYGGFGELECSGQAIGGNTGRSESVDQILNWLFVGPHEKLAAIAQILVGAELE